VRAHRCGAKEGNESTGRKVLGLSSGSYLGVSRCSGSIAEQASGIVLSPTGECASMSINCLRGISFRGV